MIQIKTVIEPTYRAIQFDSRLNCLLLEGWKLKKRMLVNHPGEVNEAFNSSICPVLYAELEKDIVDLPEEITL